MALDLTGGGNIGGQSFASLGLLLTNAPIPLLPETRQVEEELPGVNGVVDIETTFGARLIELTFEVLEDDEVDYHVTLSNIAAAFNPLKGSQVLVLERNPAKRYDVKFNGTIPVEKIAQLGLFTIPVKAFDPFPQSVNKAGTALEQGDGYALGSGYELDGPADVSFSVTSSPTTFTVSNYGNHDAYPVINIDGTGSSITITNDTTGESLSYSGSLTTGDSLVIDTKNKTIEKNGVNAFADFSGDYPKLAAGDNAFSVSATSPDLTISFDYRHTYLY